MQLDYLIFDISDEEDGRASFDAMASVMPDRLPALLAEIAAVLRWAHAGFGAPGSPGEEAHDDAVWDFDLHATVLPGQPLPIHHDQGPEGTRLRCGAVDASALVTVTFTLSGQASFCEALDLAFGLRD